MYLPPTTKKSVLRKTKGSKTKQSKDLQPSLLLLPRALSISFLRLICRGGSPDQPLLLTRSPFYSVARQVLHGSRNLCHVWKSNNRSGAASYSFCVGGEECCCCCCCCGRLRIRFSLVLSNLERLFATGHDRRRPLPRLRTFGQVSSSSLSFAPPLHPRLKPPPPPPTRKRGDLSDIRALESSATHTRIKKK